MKQRKKHSRRAVWIWAAALCLAGVFFAQDIAAALGRYFYPRRYEAFVHAYAAEYGVKENVIYAVIRTESEFNPHAESAVGARGLMQITDETFEWIKSKIASEQPITFDDMYDPATNIRFGVYLFSVCLARYEGDLSTAAAAYHSGMGLVDGLLQQAETSDDGKTLSSFPYKQMNLYVYKIQKNYQRYCALYGEQET